MWALKLPLAHLNQPLVRKHASQFRLHRNAQQSPRSLVRHCSADHRTLASHQKLLTTSLYSPGSPLLLPNGAHMINKLAACLRAHYPQFGFREVITPTIYKRSLWEKSGHWENYAEDMFEVRGRGLSGRKVDVEIGEDEEFGLKPMNCPGHCLLFSSEKRSYRDLPIRYADFSALHRNEVSGTLSGLTRVRRFHQDDGHIFCRPTQIEDEIKMTMDFIRLIYSDIFGLRDYRLVLSTRPDKGYIGSVAEWDRAEQQLRSALESTGQNWTISEGNGAFYGPKIDCVLRDSHGKEHQTATIQLDFQLPIRFGLEYVAPAPDLERLGQVGEHSSAEKLDASGPCPPVIVHRAVFGSLERFLALLIEHYNGCYPFWISPHPVIVLTVSQTPEELFYANEVVAQVGGYSANSTPQKHSISSGALAFHVAKDSSARSLGKKVREAKKAGYNFIMVVGPKDAKDRTVSLQFSNQRNSKDAAEKLSSLTGSIEGSAVVTNPLTVRKFFELLQEDYQ